MEKETKNENANFKIVILFVILTLLASFGICILVYYNQIRTIDFSLEDFQKMEDNHTKATITDISEQGNYLKVEGECFEEIKIYEIYIGLQENGGDLKMYKTERLENRKFYTLIKQKNIPEQAKISIIYQCNGEKIFIQTDRKVGEDQNEQIK